MASRSRRKEIKRAGDNQRDDYNQTNFMMKPKTQTSIAHTHTHIVEVHF